MRYFKEPTGDNPKYTCGSCNKQVGNQHKAVQCDICNYWNHIKCDGIDNKNYELMKKSQTTIHHLCKICKKENFPFQDLSDDQFKTSIVKNVEIREYLNLRTSPSTTLKILVNDLDKQINETSINCDYYDYSTSIPKANNKNHSMFHLNIASLGLHKEELITSLSLLNIDFDVIAVTETKIRKGKNPVFNLELSGYNHYQTPSECDKGGTLLYFKSHFKNKRRKDLEEKMYKSCELESVFIEIINEGKKNTIYGCIYRHPSMDIEEFNKNYFD